MGGFVDLYANYNYYLKNFNYTSIVISCVLSTGTIFGIYKENEYCLIDNDENLSEAEMKCLMQTLQPGSNLIASGYCMYSSSTILMLTLGNGVYGFTLDTSIGEFILTHSNLKIPPRGRIYSFNEAKSYQWPPPMQRYLSDLKQGKTETGVLYSSRYIGSMVKYLKDFFYFRF